VREEIGFWFGQAEADFKSATNLLNSGDFYASVFFSQQTAEKSLKAAYLQEKKLGIKTHNLVFLARELGAPERIITNCAELTPDYIATRYPAAAMGAPFESYTLESAMAHLKMAKEVLEWIRGKIWK